MMVEYRLFPIDDFGRITAASTVILCDTDEQAGVKAKALSLGPKVEVWQGSRMVAVLTEAVQGIATPPPPATGKCLAARDTR